MLTCRTTKWAECGLRAMDEFYSLHEVFQRTWAIEKTVLTIQHEFRNASDRRCKHWPAACHGFHEDQRDTLAAAREHNQAGRCVVCVELLARQMADQPDLVPEM